MLEGLIILNKPPGITSAAAVARVKRLLPRGTKIGHAGTLDRFATGVLVLLVGRATRQCERVMGWVKCYEAVIKFGCTTETDDPDTPERPCPAARECSLASIQAALASFAGDIMQVPPAYSALKSAGRRASDRVRRGEPPPPLAARPVRIYQIEIIEYVWPLLRIRVECGRGTYIRSIARDLGAALGVGGYLLELRRTRIGQCRIGDAISLEALERADVRSTIRSVESSAPNREQANDCKEPG